MTTTKRLIIGCGYLGRPLAASWIAHGDSVFATTRSEETARQLEKYGLHPVIADVTKPETLRSLPAVDTAVFAVGYDSRAGLSREQVYAGGLANVLEALPKSVRRLVFVSTTGVYGDAGGEIVDESTPCQPLREGGKAFVAAENLLRAHSDWSTRSTILRMAGIYGPGRIPRGEDIRQGKPIPAAAGGALNLIHVDDAVSAVQLASDATEVADVYIVSDGSPVARREYYREVARRYQAPEPSFESPPEDSPAAQRAQADRKMSNQRIKEQLRFSPNYPTYQDGLRSIIGPNGDSDVT